jgi:hypothetical protein
LGEVIDFPFNSVVCTRLGFLKEAKKVLVEEDYHDLLEAILVYDNDNHSEGWLEEAVAHYYNLPERI